MRSFQNILLLAPLMMITACASLIGGVKQEMTFNSEPEGATVYVDGLEKGKTPLVVKLRKDEYKRITFKKTGYRDKAINLRSKFDPVGLLNLIVSTGFTTDALTGAMFEYAPGKYRVNLEKAHREVSSKHLDRNYKNDLANFLTNNYSTLKRQCLVACENVNFETLNWLVAKVYKKDSKITKQYTLKAFAISDDPIEYLRQLESDVQQMVIVQAAR